MAQYRVQFSQHHASYNAGGIGFFTPVVAQALSDAAVGTLLDAVPATTAHVKGVTAKHAVALAAAREVVQSEADRQLLVAQVCVL